MEEYKQPAQQDQIIDEIEMAVRALDKVERMYGLGRLTYYWHEVEDLRLRHCPEVYRKIKIKGEGATAADWQEANDKATLLVARELGRRDAFEVEARFALDPDNLRDVLYVYSEEFVEELSYGYHQGQFNENQKRRLWNVLDDLDGEWEALCDTLEGRFGEMSQIGAVRFAQSELHRGIEARITGDAAMRTIARLPEMKESLGYRLVELSSHLAANIIIDGDKLDYGDVTRIELGRYTFEDVYGDCPCEADQGSCCDKAGWLFYIKDNGNKHMAINKFLVDFNSEKFDELADLSERYQRFWTLVHSGKVDEALEIDLPYEDDKREMGGIVGKLYKAIADIKLFARDSLDDFGALRDEALQQFRWSSFGSVLYNCFDVMTCDYYRNLGYISGTDSKYGVIREPLDFFNECWENLFRWLVRDLKCRLFEPAWDAWRTYRVYCENNGCFRVGGTREDPDVTRRTLELQQTMIDVFNDLSEKEMPKFSTEPVSVSEVANAMRKLLKDGNAFLNPTASDRMGVCLDYLIKMVNACLRSQEWGMLSNTIFIRLLVSMAGIRNYDVYDDEAEQFEGQWRNLRNSLDTYLLFLSEQVVSPEIENLQAWLSRNRSITKVKPGSSLKRLVSAEVVTGLRDECLSVAISVHEESESKSLRLLYAGNITWEYDEGDFLKVRSTVEKSCDQASREKRAALARSESPFFPRPKTPSGPDEMTEMLTACLEAEDESCEWPAVSDAQLLELGGDQRVIDYINSDPIVLWRYPYYQYLQKRKEYLDAGFKIASEAEEHLVAFLTTTLEEYDAKFAEQFRSDPEEYRYQVERHDSYKQKYIYDVYGKFDQELTQAKKEREVVQQAQAEKAKEEALLARGRREGVAAAVGVKLSCGGVTATPIPVLVAGFTAEGRKQAIEIVNTKAPEMRLMSKGNLRRLFGTHNNTIGNWFKGKKAPEGFGDALKKNDWDAMLLCATAYRAKRKTGDVMNCKKLVHNISDELMAEMGADLPDGRCADTQ